MKPDLARMRRAIADFLEASGLDLKDVNLSSTPERVAEAWDSEFLDGYRVSPREALGELYDVPKGSAGELVVLTDLRFHSMCPHHLLPYQGRAHLAYAPRKYLVGFGRLSSLLECFAHRLILQEELARVVARSMAELLGSPATACVIEAEQGCLRLRGDKQGEARTHSEAYEGTFRTDRQLRRELWSRIEGRR